MSDDDINKLIRDMYAKVSVNYDRIERMHKDLYGNGRPGLLQRLTSIEEQVAIKIGRRPLVGGALSGAVVSGLALVTAAVVSALL